MMFKRVAFSIYGFGFGVWYSAWANILTISIGFLTIHIPLPKKAQEADDE